MKDFHVVDLTPQGELRSSATYDSATLERLPGCADLIARISGQLYQLPEKFDLELTAGKQPVSLRWRAVAATAGIATIRCGAELASVSLLATGINADADTITLHAFQQHLTIALHDTGYEPGFAMLDLRDRPLVATVAFNSPQEDFERLIVAVADRCFAASYFRYHALA